MHPIHSLLNSYGLTQQSAASRLQTWNDRQTTRFLIDAYQTVEESAASAVMESTYVANGSMSGDVTDCGEFECRRRAVRECCIFAGLYADSVITNHPFGMFYEKEKWDDVSKRELFHRILLIWDQMPLLDAGLIQYTRTLISRCKCCHEDYKKEKLKFERELNESLAKDIGIFIKQCAISGFNWKIEYVGGDDIVEHGGFLKIFRDLPDDLTKCVGKRNGRLSKSLIKKYDLMQPLVTPLINDYYSQGMYATEGAKCLVNRGLRVAAPQFYDNPDKLLQTELLVANIAHNVPIVLPQAFDEIIRLREMESGVFSLYRKKLNDLAETISSETKLSSEKIRNAVNQTLMPELTALRVSVEEYVRKHREKAKQDLLFGTALTTFGVFAATFNGVLGSILGGLGVKYLGTGLESLNSVHKDPDSVRENPLYFLWKAGQCK